VYLGVPEDAAQPYVLGARALLLSLTGPAKKARDSQSSKEMDDMGFLTSRARQGVCAPPQR
jgi:hypothetical protein